MEEHDLLYKFGPLHRENRKYDDSQKVHVSIKQYILAQSTVNIDCSGNHYIGMGS